ncbi:MAG: F390 synthetase-related protein [Candidatus Microsaccharimonas sp.]
MSKLRTLRVFAATRWFKQFKTRAELEAYQLRMLNKQFAYFRNTSPHFHNLPTIHSLADLAQIPTMDKKLMMAEFNSMNTVGIDRDTALEMAIGDEKKRDFSSSFKDIAIGLSSGTSGHRGMFIVSTKEQEEWAGKILARYLPKKALLGQKIALFLRADNSLYQTVNSPVISFEYFDIYKDMDANIERLKAYQPTLLVAPPSVLGIIAEKVTKGELTPNYTKVIAVAEVLEASDEKYFKKVFKQKIIHQIYQCTEGFLAHTCEKGTLHLNEDVAVFEKEYLDKRRFVPVVTDFHRTSQPIVRYRLNDVLIEKASPCRCGSVFTALSRIEGREGDILYFKNSKKDDVRVFSDMMSRCILYGSGFREYRVVQTEYNHLDIYVDVLNKKVKQSISREIDRLASTLHFLPPTITFKPYEPDYSKKMRRVERQFEI